MLANTSQHQFPRLEDLTNNVVISAVLYHYKFVCTIHILNYSHDKVEVHLDNNHWIMISWLFAPLTRVIGSALTASPTLPIELNDDGQWFRFLDAHWRLRQQKNVWQLRGICWECLVVSLNQNIRQLTTVWPPPSLTSLLTLGVFFSFFKFVFDEFFIHPRIKIAVREDRKDIIR